MMKASELIEELREAIVEHGDLEVRATWEGITRAYSKPVVHMIPEWDSNGHKLLVINSDGPRSHEELMRQVVTVRRP